MNVTNLSINEINESLSKSDILSEKYKVLFKALYKKRSFSTHVDNNTTLSIKLLQLDYSNVYPVTYTPKKPKEAQGASKTSVEPVFSVYFNPGKRIYYYELESLQKQTKKGGKKHTKEGEDLSTSVKSTSESSTKPRLNIKTTSVDIQVSGLYFQGLLYMFKDKRHAHEIIDKIKKTRVPCLYRDGSSGGSSSSSSSGSSSGSTHPEVYTNEFELRVREDSGLEDYSIDYSSDILEIRYFNKLLELKKDIIVKFFPDIKKEELLEFKEVNEMYDSIKDEEYDPIKKCPHKYIVNGKCKVCFQVLDDVDTFDNEESYIPTKEVYQRTDSLYNTFYKNVLSHVKRMSTNTNKITRYLIHLTKALIDKDTENASKELYNLYSHIYFFSAILKQKIPTRYIMKDKFEQTADVLLEKPIKHSFSKPTIVNMLKKAYSKIKKIKITDYYNSDSLDEIKTTSLYNYYYVQARRVDPTVKKDDYYKIFKIINAIKKSSKDKIKSKGNTVKNEKYFNILPFYRSAKSKSNKTFTDKTKKVTPSSLQSELHSNIMKREEEMSKNRFFDTIHFVCPVAKDRLHIWNNDKCAECSLEKHTRDEKYYHKFKNFKFYNPQTYSINTNKVKDTTPMGSVVIKKKSNTDMLWFVKKDYSSKVIQTFKLPIYSFDKFKNNEDFSLFYQLKYVTDQMYFYKNIEDKDYSRMSARISHIIKREVKEATWFLLNSLCKWILEFNKGEMSTFINTYLLNLDNVFKPKNIGTEDEDMVEYDLLEYIDKYDNPLYKDEDTEGTGELDDSDNREGIHSDIDFTSIDIDAEEIESNIPNSDD